MKDFDFKTFLKSTTLVLEKLLEMLAGKVIFVILEFRWSIFVSISLNSFFQYTCFSKKLREKAWGNFENKFHFSLSERL